MPTHFPNTPVQTDGMDRGRVVPRPRIEHLTGCWMKRLVLNQSLRLRERPVRMNALCLVGSSRTQDARGLSRLGVV